MRSDLSSIDKLLMCMSKPQPGDYGPNKILVNVKNEPNTVILSDSSRSSFGDNDVIEFGPIKVKPRKRPAPTLATGRRSKYEVLTPDEEKKRNIRRARNRAAAERVRISRLTVEQQLQEQIDALEQTEKHLSDVVQKLENQKLQLETRIFTHARMCFNENVPSISQCSLPVDFDSCATYDQISSPQVFYKQIDNGINDSVFDDFFNRYDEQNPGKIVTTHDYLQDFDFLMEP